MRVSVIVATMNRSADLGRLLDSLEAQSRPPEEVWIVDQSADGNTRELTARRIPSFCGGKTGLRYTHRACPGLAAARNAGMDLAEGDILSFLDDDVVLDPGYYAEVVRCFENEPHTGGLSGNDLAARRQPGIKGALRRSLDRIFLLDDHRGGLTWSGFGYPIFDRGVERATPVRMLPGCNMNFTRSAVNDLRFDEWFDGYGFREDAEFSYRVSLKNGLWMVPQARLSHLHSASNRLNVFESRRMEFRNYLYVFLKFKPRTLLPLFLYSVLGIVVMDLLEAVASCGSASKTEKLRADFAALRSLDLSLRSFERKWGM